MLRNLWKENETLRELICGILISGAFLQVLLALAFPPRLYRAIGLWSGLLCGCLMAVHMARSLEIAVELDEKSAAGYLRKTSILRYLCVCVILVAVALSGIGDPISFVLGTLGLKTGAYLQPVVHRLLLKFRKENTNQDKEVSKE